MVRVLAQARPSSVRRRPPSRPRTGPAHAVLILASAYFLLPIFWLIVNSAKSNGDLFDTNGMWFAPHFALGRNLSELFSYQNGIFSRWLANSLIYAGGGAAVATLLAALAGYSLAKFEFAGKRLIFWVILGSIMVPATVLALPLYLLFSSLGITNTYWAVLLPSIVSPLGVYLMRIYIAGSIPDELLESARIDGAGETKIFTGIVLRLVSPALITVFLFQFVAIWNNFFLPIVMLANNDLYPVTLGLQTLNESPDVSHEYYNLVITGSLVSVLPFVISFLLLRKYWRSGLLAGSVVG